MSLVAAASLLAIAACSGGEEAPSGMGGAGGEPFVCEPRPDEPPTAQFNRIDPQFESSDPTMTRLCDEGATPPADLENPWDLHCQIEAGRGAAAAEVADPVGSPGTELEFAL